METRRFRLGDLRPNPFRDLDRYPVAEEEVERLLASFERSGVWGEGRLVSRVQDGTPEICFGHAVVEALRRHLGPDHEIEVAVADLSDAEMLRRMVDENEVRRQRSALMDQEVIAGVVQGFAEGRIELDPPPKRTPHSTLRAAPSFLQGDLPATSREDQRRYTASTVADHLGWDRTRVEYTLGALELIEQEEVERREFKGMSAQQAESYVRDLRKALQRGNGSRPGDDPPAQPVEPLETEEAAPPPAVGAYLDALEEMVVCGERLDDALPGLDPKTLGEIAAVQAAASAALEELRGEIDRLREEAAP